MTNHHYDNSERLEGVSEQDWREALDELTAYLTWRLRGKTAKGAHSEKVLGMPAFDYYQEEAVVKLIEDDWKWQDHFSLGKQLEKIAANLITKQKERYEREHPWMKDDPSTGSGTDENHEERFIKRKPELIEFTDDIDQYGDVMDDDGQEELDETYAVVMALVADNEELTLYVEFIESAIKESEPDIIITHHPADTNNDHLQTSMACQEAIRLFQRRPEVKRVREFWYMEVPSCTEWKINNAMQIFNPNGFVEVGKEGVDAKIKALSMYRGVMRPYPHPRSSEYISGLAAVRCSQWGVNYAEAFEVVLRAY